MATLFGTKRSMSKIKVEKESNDELESYQDNIAATTLTSSSSRKQASSSISSFNDLGLCEWILKSCSAMGFRRPTPIQSACIPSIIAGNNVMGCAQTGSGKTAAFALPMLQHLSQDPYGVFGVVIVPTRELAIQIKEQISALGAPIGVRVALVIGGMGIIDQSIALSKKPHFICATPGRLRHHLEGADPPNLSRCKYLVLDEADRLLSTGFNSELKVILSNMSRQRQTLIFSATLTESLEELEKLASSSTLRYDLSKKQNVPTNLLQQYLLMPPHVKMCYLVGILKTLVNDN
jgi:ATP-dependent RNA helicase DDX49/DBP8